MLPIRFALTFIYTMTAQKMILTIEILTFIFWRHLFLEDIIHGLVCDEEQVLVFIAFGCR